MKLFKFIAPALLSIVLMACGGNTEAGHKDHDGHGHEAKTECAEKCSGEKDKKDCASECTEEEKAAGCADKKECKDKSECKDKKDCASSCEEGEKEACCSKDKKESTVEEEVEETK